MSAPGIRIVDSRPIRPGYSEGNSLVYPQTDDCAVVYQAAGTYQTTVTIHWYGWEWETAPWPTPRPRKVTLPTTSAVLEVGVCEVHTIPTDRLPEPGPPKPGTPRSCVAGDTH